MAASQAQMELIVKRRDRVREALAQLEADGGNMTALVNKVALECGVSTTIVYADIRAVRGKKARRERREKP